MNYQDAITRDKNILGGKPVLKGTRIAVELILKKLSEGATVADLLKNYPHLHEGQIYAALEYAAAVMASAGKALPDPCRQNPARHSFVIRTS